MKMKTKRTNKTKSFKVCNDEEIVQLKQKYETIESEKEAIKRFSDFPLSQKTLKGLADSKYAHPTDIQRESIGPVLQGKDVLGAAQTGSGKTLAFLIPVLEHLFVNKWSRTDGIGATIISPTRELAYQIFETLKKIGRYHDFSAGLIIGGKNLKFERKRMDKCNILICTPGRLLQHMDENPLFDANSMEMLVLDEADRCLDMGFEQTLNAIIEHFPPQRQTLLFSATQTNSVQDLARLNLHDPIYVGYKQKSGLMEVGIPELLQQSYVVVPLEDKVTMLWSFIRNHQKHKIIVFLTSCKQVKYIYEIFCKLRPGISLLALYGTLHQDRRLAIYQDFVKKSNVVLFATDIASRGLDFPAVNWVVQSDCPEDVTQYIHRAGRSARNKARGESLLVLLPSEEKAMLEQLQQKEITVRKIHIDPKKLFSPRVKIEAFLAQSPELKASAQRAFVSYIKSIFLMRNKGVFDVRELDFDAYSKSLGLAVTPRVRFLERYLQKGIKKIDKKHKQKETNSSESNILESNNFNFLRADTESEREEEDDDVLLKVKRIDHDIQPEDPENMSLEKELLQPLAPPKKEKLLTKAALAKKAIKKKLQMNEKRKFNEDGAEIVDTRKQLQSSLAREYEEKLASTGGINIQLAKDLLNEEDIYDKQRFRELVKQRHKARKQKLKKRKDKDVTDDEGGKESLLEDYESENSVDLSWLPDPNKIYSSNKSADGKKVETSKRKASSSEEEDNISGSDSENDLDAPPVTKKIKVTSKLSLDDAEIIATQLLAQN